MACGSLSFFIPVFFTPPSLLACHLLCLLLSSFLLFSLLSLHFSLLPASFLCLTFLSVVFIPSLFPPFLPRSFPPFWFLLPSLHLLSLPSFIGFTLLCCFLCFLSFLPTSTVFPPSCTALNYSLFFSFLSCSSFFHLCQPFFVFAFLYFSSLFYNNQHCPCEGGAHYLYVFRPPVVSLTLTPPPPPQRGTVLSLTFDL